MLSNFSFLASYWLFLLPFIYVWLLWRKKLSVHWPQFRPTLSIRYPLLNDLKLNDDYTSKKKGLSLLEKINCDQLIALSIFFLIIALAQPVTYKAPDNVNLNSEKYVNMILVIDTALSMSLKDYKTNGLPISRLSMVQKLLISLIKSSPNNKMALVLLSNPPALWLPLTNDKDVLINAISRTSTLLGGRISDMGATFNLIAEQFKREQDKTIILLSDGGTQLGDVSPQAAAKQLKQKGFKLYILAMGASGNDAQAYDDSSLIYEPANLKRLQLVIDESDGQLFNAQNENDYRLLLPLLTKPLNKSDTNSLEQQFVIVYYPIALFIAMLLLFYTFFMHTCQSANASHTNIKGVNSDF